jgi:maltose O-acetyltransferase
MLKLARRLKRAIRHDAGAAKLRARGTRLGRDVYLAPTATIDPDFCWLVAIGDETTIAPGVRILAHDASTKRRLGYSRVARVEIGSRVFIGADSILLPGVTVGDDAIIGAGSVVRNDVPEGAMVAGNPALVVGRTDDYVSNHRLRLADSQLFDRDRFTVGGGVTDDAKEEMWERLEEEPGYVH